MECGAREVKSCHWCDSLAKWGVTADTGLVPQQVCCPSSEVKSCPVCKTNAGARIYSYHTRAEENGVEVEREECPHCLFSEKMKEITVTFRKTMKDLKIPFDRAGKYDTVDELYTECLSHLFHSLKGFDWRRPESFEKYLNTCMTNKKAEVLKAISIRNNPPKPKETERKRRARDIEEKGVAVRHRKKPPNVNQLQDREEVNTDEQIQAEQTLLQERRDELKAFLASLDPEVAKVFKRANGLTRGGVKQRHCDIARELDIHPNTVTNRLERAEEQRKRWVENMVAN